MYLHIGNNVMIKHSDIVAILDLDITTTSKITRNFLTKCQSENTVISVSDDLPKTFILANDKKTTKIYISPISATTLQKRYYEVNLNI